MDNYSGESEFIESLDFLSPPVRRIHSSKPGLGNAYNAGTNNVHLLRGFRNKLLRQIPFASKHVKTNYSESSTSLILRKTSERQILEQCSIVSFASLPQPEIAICTPLKGDKYPNNSEKPLIKVTVIPKTDQVKAAKLLRRRRFIPKAVQSTTSNHENSIQTKNLYLIVAGRRREKIYEIKTTGSANLSSDHDSSSKNEEHSISQLANFKHLIQSLNMDRKKKKEKVAPPPGEHSDAQDLGQCRCSPNHECSNVKEAPKKSRVKIFGRLGISEDDKYVLRYGATVNDKQVMSDVAQLTSDFSPIIAETSYGITEEEPEHLQGSCLQAAHNYDLDLEKPPVTDIISKESQGTQVNFKVEFASLAQARYATVSNKKVQCSCHGNRSEHNTLKDCQSPLVIISVYPKQSPEDLVKSDHSAGVNTKSWSPTADNNTYTSNQITKTEKVPNKSDTKRNYKNPIMSRSTSPVKMTSRSKVADDSVKGQISERRSPDRQKALRAIKEKIREKDKLKQDANTRKLPTKLNTTNATQVSKNFQNLTVSNATQVSKRNQRQCDVSLVTQPSNKNHQIGNTANGTHASGIQNNSGSNSNQYANGADSLTVSNAIQCEETVDSLHKFLSPPKLPRHKPVKHLRIQMSKATQVAKDSELFSNHATQVSMNDPVTISDGTQISKDLPNSISARVKNQETFVAKPTQVYNGDQTTKYNSKTKADTGTNTEHAKTKKAIIDTYTKKLTEKMNQRDYSPSKYVNSKVTINIDGDREYYDVLFNQNNLTTDLTIRKKVKDVGSQKCAEPTLESLLCLPDCDVERGEFMSGSQSPTKCPSILLYNNPSEEKFQLTQRVSRLTIRDSLEIGHRREDKCSNNIKNTQTCLMSQVTDNEINETEFLAPIKHFIGDDCSISDPIERDKQIRELLGVDKVKTNYTKINQGCFCNDDVGNPYRCIYRQECKTSQVTEINFKFQELWPQAGQTVHPKDKATLSVQCQRGYPKLTESERKTLRRTCFSKDEKVGSFVKYSADECLNKEYKPFNNVQSAIYQQLILDRDIQVFLQMEQFSKQKPIILSRKQYDKVKKTIQKTLCTKKSVHDRRKTLYSKRESSEVSVGEVRTKKVKNSKAHHGKAKKHRGRTATTQEPQCGIEARIDAILCARESNKHPSKISESGRCRRQPPNTDNSRGHCPDQNLTRGDAKLNKAIREKKNEAQSIIELHNNNKQRLQIVTERNVGISGDRANRYMDHLSSIPESFDRSSKKLQTPDRNYMKCLNRDEEEPQKEAEVETYVLFNAENARASPKNAEKETECEDARKTMSSVEIGYASVAFLKQVAYSSTDVGALSESSLGHLNSFHTLFRGHRKCATPNLGTSAFSLYSEDGYKYNLQNKCQIEPQDSKPKKPFLRRLMSCLVMRSTKISELKLQNAPQSDLPSVNSSLDSYHISTSLGAMEVSSSIYDTSASFYSNHTILPVNAKIKRGFFSSVRGFLTNRKS